VTGPLFVKRVMTSLLRHQAASPPAYTCEQKHTGKTQYCTICYLCAYGIFLHDWHCNNWSCWL